MVKYWFWMFCIIVFITESRSRKYDIELEARKIYGQDLKSVLLRFRKTPDYIRILNGELEDLRRHLIANSALHQYYFVRKLKTAVNEAVADNSSNAALRQRSTTGEYYTKYIGLHRKPIIRQHTHNMSGIERLDQYYKINPLLTLKIRNKMVDLGFEYAGHIIHGLIKSISPDSQSKSTLLPFDNSGLGPSTHYSHKVTQLQTMQEQETTKAEDLYRNFKKDARHI